MLLLVAMSLGIGEAKAETEYHVMYVDENGVEQITPENVEVTVLGYRFPHDSLKQGLTFKAPSRIATVLF